VRLDEDWRCVLAKFVLAKCVLAKFYGLKNLILRSFE